MKKILCILMIVAMLMSVCLITASAEATTENSNKAINTPATSTGDEVDNWLFFQKFSDRYAYPQYDDPVIFYEEVYYHYNTDGEIEWVLIRGYTRFNPPWVLYPYGVFGDRVLRMTEVPNHFCLDYCIYSVIEDDFYDISEKRNADKFPLNTVFNELNIGELIGDMDKDNKLTVKDATYIQKCLAEIIDFPENDQVDGVHEKVNKSFEYLAYISDFNRDGVRNVRDATAIQKHIAGIAP